MPSKSFYITTPIYFPSGTWHLGTCYSTVVTDTIARFKRMSGFDVYFQTGTDEHGQKIAEKAKAAGLLPKAFVDGLIADLKDIWETLDISYDRFLRTTDEAHILAVQNIFKRLYDKGDIYKGEYEGLYCTPCESYWTSTQLKDGKCPDCGREVTKTKEESYFFRLTKYADRIEKLFKESSGFLAPESRVNEMYNNFIKPGLQDLSVSRTTVDWGIPVPWDTAHTVYVWFDALLNYITGLGFTTDNETLYQKFWPANVQIMAKEIVRFHSIIWPAMLMALDIPLPKKLYAHGWLLFNNDKMSKSKGNVIDPRAISDMYGSDAVRYILLKDGPVRDDSSYSSRGFLMSLNSDLVNDLGNLVSRTVAMIEQSFKGEIPQKGPILEEDKELIEAAEALKDKVAEKIDAMKLPEALAEIFALVGRANKYIDETKPWVLQKNEADKDRLAAVLYNLAEAIRFAAVLLQPFLTKSPKKIFAKLGVTGSYLKSFESLTFGTMPSGLAVTKGDALFARVKVDDELKKLEQSAGKPYVRKAAQPALTETKDNVVAVKPDENGMITIDYFAGIQLKTGKIIACEKVENADKLLKSTIDTGEESPRTIVSGIAKWYTPEEMTGKNVVIVANLRPAKLRGIISEGMVLCAEHDGQLALVSPEKVLPAGSEVR